MKNCEVERMLNVQRSIFNVQVSEATKTQRPEGAQRLALCLRLRRWNLSQTFCTDFNEAACIEIFSVSRLTICMQPIYTSLRTARNEREAIPCVTQPPFLRL